MNKREMFRSFLSTLTESTNDKKLMKSLTEGFNIIFESEVRTVTIEDLENQGYEGSDADLATSLFEYGLIWKHVDGEYKFIYKINSANDRFSWASYSDKTDPFKEWDWALEDDNLASLLSYIDTSVETLKSLPLPQLVYTLYSMYGSEEIFGTDYDGGFKVVDPDLEG